ncbi:hypothetical protein QFC19_007459 [Naganishia cerealis]|uniref:Uncharacterized protein n=1 Tax=Naganishia cerealis TaxID=610337 RepID=A0ACC2VA57_9TREE|nr:hypothetical protein QFC19_007459 [Naganishia cerealis]
MSASSKPIALVTGASSGIGRTSSVALIKAGWRVVLSGRRKEELEATAEMGRKALREEGKEDEARDDQLVLIAVGDVSKESNVKEMFEQIQKEYGESVRGVFLTRYLPKDSLFLGRLDLLFNVSHFKSIAYGQSRQFNAVSFYRMPASQAKPSLWKT